MRGGKIYPKSGNWLRVAWGVFANTLKAEAGEMSLPSRAFSHSKFIAFILSGAEVIPPLVDLTPQDT